jgi:two-component system, chemotaxis family, chemotaxis protein CheY
MDILMPEMDGPEAVRRIRALELARGILPKSGAKVIMVTAVEDMKDVIRSFQEFCDAYLVKPVDVGKLLDHLKGFGLI